VATVAGDFNGCAQTTDWNPLETPTVFEYKFYCPAIGLVLESHVDGRAFVELVTYTLGGPGGPSTPSPEPTPQPTPDPTPDPTPQGTPVSPSPDDPEDEDAGENEDAEDDDGGGSGQLTEGEELLPLAGITVEQAIAAAQAYAAAQGIQGEVGEVELEQEDGRLVFEVEIGDEEIEVDAQTGEIITDDDEGDDADEDTEDASGGSGQDDEEDED
jgi:uncharacterized membrane protein YkoI